MFVLNACWKQLFVATDGNAMVQEIQTTLNAIYVVTYMPHYITFCMLWDRESILWLTKKGRNKIYILYWMNILQWSATHFWLKADDELWTSHTFLFENLMNYDLRIVYIARVQYFSKGGVLTALKNLLEEKINHATRVRKHVCKFNYQIFSLISLWINLIYCNH